MLPKPTAGVPSGQRFDGSVSVSVTIDARALRYVWPRQLVSLEELSDLTGLPTPALASAISTIGDVGLVRIVVDTFGPPRLEWKNAGMNSSALGDPVIYGARGVSPALAAFAPEFAVDWARTYAPRIKDAVEQGLSSGGRFTRVVPAKGDYALDIWLDGYTPTTPPMGMGTWKADVFAIWRLTRASDGAILACDYAEGQGSFRKARSQPNHWAFAAAVQDMIGAVFQALGDDPQRHLAALESAGLGRIGGAGVLPAAAVKWAERVTAGWPQLRAGMTVDEVSALIGRVGAPRGWDPVFILPVVWDVATSKGTSRGGSLTTLRFRVYRTDLYTLLFLVDDIDVKTAELPSGAALLVWQMRK